MSPLGLPGRHRRRQPPPGSRPGLIVVPPEGRATAIRVMRYEPERCEEAELADPAALPDWLEKGGVAWIDVQGFGDGSALEALRDVLDIHPLAMADVANVPQRPKAEDYGDRHLVIAQMACPIDGGERLAVEQVSLVLGPGWVVTFQEQPGDVFDPLRERLRSNAGVARRMGADFLLYALLDAVVDGYFPALESLGEKLDALEGAVLERPSRDALVRLHELRRTLLALRQIQWRQREAVGQLLRDEVSPVTEPVRVYLRDVHDHAWQILDALDTYRDMAVGLMDIHLSSSSNRLNEVMKTLTVIASIFIPLSFVAGVYGMNFEHMPELGWRWGYPAALLGMAAIGLGLLAWFRHRGWLGSTDRG